MGLSVKYGDNVGDIYAVAYVLVYMYVIDEVESRA